MISLLVPFALSAQWLETKLTASDAAASDEYGSAVAISGDRIVVGAPRDDFPGTDPGSAYVYELNGTEWVETKLTASDGAPFDEFGTAVGISGDRVVVGAEFHDEGALNAGAVYVYEWDGLGWTETKLTASDATLADRFGAAVAILDDRIVVGALDDEMGNGAGAVYIYDWDGVGWVETKLTASDAAPADQFGLSVAVSGDRVVVGAQIDDDNGVSSGAAYVFDWNGLKWVETKLTASNGSSSDWYGASVAVSGDRVVVGARFNDTMNGSNSGSIYVYDWNGAMWVETRLIASDGSAFDELGQAVAMTADRIVVGAHNYNLIGATYVYDWNGSQWEELKLMASDGTSLDRSGFGVGYGFSVALTSERIVVGARFDDGAGDESGSAYLYEMGDGLMLSVTGDCPGEVTLTATAARPNEDVALFFGLDIGTSAVPFGACAGTELDLAFARPWGSLSTDENGQGTIVREIPSFGCGRRFQAMDRSCSTSNTVEFP